MIESNLKAFLIYIFVYCFHNFGKDFFCAGNKTIRYFALFVVYVNGKPSLLLSGSCYVIVKDRCGIHYQFEKSECVARREVSYIN